MLTGYRTTEDLIRSFKALTKEEDQSSIKNDDILLSLSRGQRHCYSIVAIRQPDLVTTLIQDDVVIKQDSRNRLYYFEIPEAAFENRIKQIRYDGIVLKPGGILDPGSVTSGSYAQRYPCGFYVSKRKIYLTPFLNTAPDASKLNIYIIEDPENLVFTQGQVTAVGESDNYVQVDISQFSNSSLTAADFSADVPYVNIIDKDTGHVKASLQIKFIEGTKVTFKSSPTLPVVSNKVIDTSIVDKGIEVGDFICCVRGSCIPHLNDLVADFLVDYAIWEIKTSAIESEMADFAYRKMKDKLDLIEKTWAGRPKRRGLKSVNVAWKKTRRRYW